MSDEWKDVGLEAFEQPLASCFARYVERHGGEAGSLAGLRKSERGEMVLLEVKTFRPKKPYYAIKSKEPVGVAFFGEDSYPRVFSLREDFPDTPHQNWVPEGEPFSLCIDDRSWTEARVTFTSAELLQRIQEWFKKAGLGTLHGLDQPLDPVYLSTQTTIILPARALEERCDLVGWRIEAGDNNIIRTFPKERFPREKIKAMKGATFITLEIESAQRMTRMRFAPRSLAGLHDELGERGLDLYAEIKRKIDAWVTEEDAWKEFRFQSTCLGIIVRIPVIHPVTGDTGTKSTIGFLSGKSLGEVGFALGCLGKLTEGEKKELKSPISYTPMVAKELKLKSDLPLDVVNICVEFDMDLAARMAGRDRPDERKALMIGAGAVGSLVADSMAREGRFKWTIVDDDVLLPHNLERHTLYGPHLGGSKADSLAFKLRWTVEGIETEGIHANFITPGEEAERIEGILKEASIILDASASEFVGRRLCDHACAARSAKFFYNPAGTASVLMVEDEKRTVDLRALEAVFYARVLEDPKLSGLLEAKGEQMQYSGNCSALTNKMPASKAQTLSGLIATGLGQALDEPGACVRIWRLGPDGSVEATRFDPAPIPLFEVPGWTIRILPAVARDITLMRDARLPNETGGVLLGVVDIPKKRIEVIKALPAPPDSKESPAEFIRGVEGLKETVMAMLAKTLDHIRYIGEWHTHPYGCGSGQSGLDLAQICELARTLSAEECPGIQAIASDQGLTVHLLDWVERLACS
jgi:molybdopterin/thiamine biosynthesis adenylyltransferase